MRQFKISPSIKKLLKNIYIQAVLVGLLLMLPFIAYLSLTGRIVAPLNTMPGWSIPNVQGEVFAPIPSDVNQQMLPFRQYIKDSLSKDSQIPLWNEKAFAGDTFLANPINAALSPLNFLLLFTNIYTFQNIVVMFGLFFMATSMYLLLRQLKFSWYSGVIGSVAFTYAPFSVFWSIYGIVSIPMATIPLSLFLYYKWRDHSRNINVYLIALALTLGLSVYFGHIQIALLPYGILVLAVIYDLIIKKIPTKKLLYILGSVLVAITITLGQLVPMLLQTPESHRSDETTSVDPKSWPERIDELSRITAPYDLTSGPNDLGATTRRELSVGQIPGILFIISIAILIVSLIRRKKINFPYFFLFLAAFGASWQWSDFPQTLLNVISPTFRSLASDYFLPVALLGMSVLAAYALQFVVAGVFTSKRIIKTPVKYFLVGPLIILALVSLPQLMLSKVSTLSSSYYFAFYAVFVGSIIFYILLRKIHTVKIYFALTIIIVALVQGWALYRVSQPLASPTVLETKNQLLEYVVSKKSATPMIVDYSGPQESVLYDVALINGYDSLYSESIQHRIQAINYPNKTPETYRNNSLVINNKTKPELFMNLGVEYTINSTPSSGYSQQIDGVYKSDKPAPRVYFASKITKESEDGQLSKIKSGDVGYHEVVVDGNQTLADTSSSLEYEFSVNKLTIKTESNSGGLIFIAQTYNKDWVAQLQNGDDIDIVPAYYDFSAINAPAGTNTITLTYKPKAVLVSIAVSLFVILITTAALVYSVVSRKSIGHK